MLAATVLFDAGQYLCPFSLKGQGVVAHLAHHGQEAVGAGGGEVLFKADARDEVEVGVEDFLRSMVRQYADEQADDAFDDERIALGAERKVSVGGFIANEPYAALATVDEIAFCFLALLKRLLLFA